MDDFFDTTLQNARDDLDRGGGSLAVASENLSRTGGLCYNSSLIDSEPCKTHTSHTTWVEGLSVRLLMVLMGREREYESPLRHKQSRSNVNQLLQVIR